MCMSQYHKKKTWEEEREEHVEIFLDTIRIVNEGRYITESGRCVELRIGLKQSHDSLVLGAWGCGAFCNPPEHMAVLFKETLEEPEFKDKYREVVFSIIDDHNARRPHNPEGNLLPFVRVAMERSLVISAVPTRRAAIYPLTA